jgi:putative addiction module component (TIGR02574 family)
MGVLMTVSCLIAEAKKLSPRERAELLDELICLVGPEAAYLSLTPAQQTDLERRIDELEAGKAKLIPGENAFAQLGKRS